jgi:predicted site-specific integrase-resolvase
MTGRPREVRPHWAARQIGVDVQTIWRWCREGRFTYVRRELGVPLPDGSRHVKRYWLSADEVIALKVSD